MSNSPKIIASRVSQQDAKILDKVVVEMFMESLKKFCNIDANYIYQLQKHEDEAKLSINSLLWIYRIINKQTPGQKILGLTYSKHGLIRLILHYILDTLLPYLKKYFSKNIQFQYDALCGIIELLQQFNFLCFGKYNTFSEFILNIYSETSVKPIMDGGNDIELKKELLFHLFKDLILVVTPILQGLKTINWKKIFFKKTSNQFLENEIIESHNVAFVPIICTSCNMPAIFPVRNKLNVPNACYHYFCYYCYDPCIRCPKCDLELPKDGESFVF
ncbi:Peroxisome biogenesis factor 2 [Strongyloides ratti]|uniref:RING-type E3 ubiquitin transferase (cysteine targeting) n=1 Tax=Strongyloides ratti TaxID=34506 RepID=A0A090LB30_STRRB|nr:Peroxisome biogenesis factor 2 [Strongyloides ratti]CEF66972.1 Peroxisome biogenesis factor 2 [Strongyloides ratti]